jgi:DNA polymerase
MTNTALNKNVSQDLSEIACDFRHYLQYVKQLGFQGVALSEASKAILEQWGNESASETLEMIQKDLGGCRRCQLHTGRKHVVFGDGNPRARLVLVGEGPGYEEDATGLPFVGKAGQLLTKILKAIDLTREEVYICNIIKCRPPGNRDPEPDEIAACLPFLRRQIRAIRPKFICALGAFATQTLLQTDTPISRLRGDFHAYEGIPVLPTYHPAFLLRNPDKKRHVWEDVKKLQAAYEKV